MVTTQTFAFWTCKSDKQKPKLKDHMTFGSCDIFLTERHHPDKFGDQKHCHNWDSMFSICHLTSRNHLFKWPCDGWKPLMLALSIAMVDRKRSSFVTWPCKTMWLKGNATLWVRAPRCKITFLPGLWSYTLQWR